MLSSIGNAERIENGKDYGILGENEYPIFVLHAAITNTGFVTLELLGGTILRDLPPGFFQQGALYPYYVKRITWDGDADFVGGRFIESR